MHVYDTLRVITEVKVNKVVIWLRGRKGIKVKKAARKRGKNK